MVRQQNLLAPGGLLGAGAIHGHPLASLLDDDRVNGPAFESQMWRDRLDGADWERGQ